MGITNSELYDIIVQLSERIDKQCEIVERLIKGE